jgi:hypothetical protein
VGNLRQIGKIHAPDLPQQTWDQQQNMQKRTCKQNKKHKAIVTCTPCLTHDNCWISCKPSCLAEPVTPSLVTTEQAQATKTKTTILVALNPKIKNKEDACCLMLWSSQQQLQVKFKARTIFWMASHYKDA